MSRTNPMPLRIDFYHDAPNKLEVAARIAQKAHAAGNRLLVVAPDAGTLDAFDRTLWSFSPLSFVPHCRAGHPLANQTPVLLAADVDAAISSATSPLDVLINLGEAVPEGFEQFSRLIEIVGRDDDDRLPARNRFRQYRDGGHEIVSHRLGDRP